MKPWRAPYSGLAFFLTHPSLWGWTLLGTVLSGAISIFLFVKVVQWTFPAGGAVWGAFQAFGWGFLSLIIMIAVVFPLIFNACFAKGFSNLFKLQGAATTPFIFFQTLRWRILWPLFLLAAILFVPPLIIPLFLLAANHLATIESVDLALSLYGVQTAERVEWLHRHSTAIFTMAISLALLSFLLGLTGVGWIFWIPTVYCGAFLWIRSEIKEPS